MVGPSHVSNLSDFLSCCTSPASSHRKFPAFRGSCNQIWVTQIIQDNHPLIISVLFLSQFVGIRAWTI